MGHTQHHIVAAAILKARQLTADLIIAAAFAPQVGGHHHGEEYFLAVDGIHFLAQDVFNFAHNAPRGHIQRIDAVGNLLHIAAADHKNLADNLAICRRLAETIAQHVSKLHSKNPSRYPESAQL